MTEYFCDNCACIVHEAPCPHCGAQNLQRVQSKDL